MNIECQLGGAFCTQEWLLNLLLRQRRQILVRQESLELMGGCFRQSTLMNVDSIARRVFQVKAVVPAQEKAGKLAVFDLLNAHEQRIGFLCADRVQLVLSPGVARESGEN